MMYLNFRISLSLCLTSKCIDETMKLAGMHYLHVTLKPTIEEICQSHKSCEIDPVKLKDGENLENNMESLRQYVDRIFTVITKSGVSCPTVMCDIFFSLREAAAKRFQDDLDVRYTAVSSFIFLRFFAPAILSLLFAEILRKIGWIKENDLKLDL